jgi:hypothetical protein
VEGSQKVACLPVLAAAQVRIASPDMIEGAVDPAVAAVRRFSLISLLT